MRLCTTMSHQPSYGIDSLDTVVIGSRVFIKCKDILRILVIDICCEDTIFFRINHPKTFLLSPYLGIFPKPSFLGIADKGKRLYLCTRK